MKGEFSVYWWDLDGRQNEDKRFVDVQTAMDAVQRLVNGPARFVNTRTIVTDGMDFTNFEWTAEKGCIFPDDAKARAVFPPVKA